MSAVAEQKPTSPFEHFRNEIMGREEELASILPSHVSLEKFINTAVIAVKNNPKLLGCDRLSLQGAVTKAAEDGLQPDGREGVITWFKERDKQLLTAQWNPMLYGIRKRARELGDIIIDAQVVYKNDEFLWRQGDDPCIDHKPAGLDAERGDPIGAYAIFRQGDAILHREVMDAKEIDNTKSVSRAQNGPMWTKFWTEAWRKTVIRRGSKTVPTVPELERIITREDEQVDFSLPKSNVVPLPARPAPPAIPDLTEMPTEPPAPVQAPPPIEDLPDLDAEDLHDLETPSDPPIKDQDGFLYKLHEERGFCNSADDLAELREANADMIERLSDANKVKANEILEIEQ